MKGKKKLRPFIKKNENWNIECIIIKCCGYVMIYSSFSFSCKQELETNYAVLLPVWNDLQITQLFNMLLYELWDGVKQGPHNYSLCQHNLRWVVFLWVKDYEQIISLCQDCLTSVCLISGTIIVYGTIYTLSHYIWWDNSHTGCNT